MSGFVSLNLMATTSPSNSFLLQTQGYYQGVMLDDPNSQNWITTGIIPSSQSTAIYAGLPITETNNGDAVGAEQGGRLVTTAATVGAITGFVIANQAYNGIITNSNNVPMFSPGMSVSLVRMGSNARIVVAVDSGAVAALLNQPINVALSWDFATGALTNSGTALPAKLLEINTNGMVASVSGGYANWTAGTVAVIQI